MKKLFFLYLLIFSLYSLSNAKAEIASCDIQTAAKVYHFGLGDNEQPPLFRSTTCPTHVTTIFQKTLLNSNGPINSSHLTALINEELQGKISVAILPERIRVYNLVELLRERTQIGDSLLFRKLSLLDRGSLLLDKTEQLVIQCQNCRSLGEVNIELVINQVNLSRHNSRWLKAELVTKARALVAKTPQRVSHESLKIDQFQVQVIETTRPEDFFADKNKLAFFRVNRPIGTGEPLKHTDLAGVNLVNVGTPARVFLNNANLSITRIANPIRGGKFGEVIQLRNPQTNKTILGRVTDFNKVEVEL